MSILQLRSLGIRLEFVCLAGWVTATKESTWRLVKQLLKNARVSFPTRLLDGALKLLNLRLGSLIVEFTLNDTLA